MRWINGRQPENDPHVDDSDFPKQYFVRFFGDDPRSGCVDTGIMTAQEIIDCDYPDYWEWLDESPTPLVQEDVEKAAHAFASKPHYKDDTPLSISPMLYMKQGFIAGAKWQAAIARTSPLPSNIIQQLERANPWDDGIEDKPGQILDKIDGYETAVSNLKELLKQKS